MMMVFGLLIVMVFGLPNDLKVIADLAIAEQTLLLSHQLLLH